jgi:hypothetical protein
MYSGVGVEMYSGVGVEMYSGVGVEMYSGVQFHYGVVGVESDLASVVVW